MELVRIALDELFQAWLTELGFVERWAIAFVVLAVIPVWLFETIRYAGLLGRKDFIHLAPISVRGGILSDLGPRAVALGLQREFLAIRETGAMLGEKPAPYIAPATGRNAGYYLVGMRRDLSVPIRFREQQELRPIEHEISLQLAGVTLPVSTTINGIVTILGAFPVPFRRRYKNSLIRVNMASYGDQTRLTVHVRGQYASRIRHFEPLERLFGMRREPDGSSKKGASDVPITLAKTRATETLEDLHDLIRDAAFMIQQIHDADEMEWQSRRYLMDGLVALDEYRRTAADKCKTTAKECFRQAATADLATNHHAMYFHGVMTMVDRTSESIDEATQFLERAAESEDLQLKSLVHTALAYCEAQKFHRLGKRRDKVVRIAKDHAKEAARCWLDYLKKEGIGKEPAGPAKDPSGAPKKSGRDATESGPVSLDTAQYQAIALKHPRMHPVIPYTLALVTHVDERDRDERNDRFFRAVELYSVAIRLEPDNGMFYNNRGWSLLKLVEYGRKRLPKEIQVGEDETEREISALAEMDLIEAIGHNPGNKLAHANLCLLYSTPYFRKSPDLFLPRSRYHGMKALEIDESYINGYRDLAVAHVRFGKVEEAKRYYEHALRLAEDPDKDREIIDDLKTELETMEKPPDNVQEVIKEWSKPKPELLQPRSTLPKV